MLTSLLVVSIALVSKAQKLDVSIINTGNNVMQIIGVATAPGFSAPNGEWATMNLTWRLPKSAAEPPPTVGMPPSVTPEVTGERTEFTGAEPRDAFGGGLDLTMFDLTTFGEPDDGYWYFQVTGTAGTTQNLPTGTSIVLYEFALPPTWSCPGCVEILTTEVPGLIAHDISTTSYIDNAMMPPPDMDVLNIVTNNAPLPVEFVSFEARKWGAAAKLSWAASNEQNIDRYYIERSSDGVSYSRIGYVAPLPPASVNSYSYRDEHPLNGNNYYRIREGDKDGKATYSDTRVLRFGSTNGFAVSIYPVPTADKLKVHIEAGVNKNATLRIADIHGRTLKLQAVQMKTEGNLETVEVVELKPGIYVIELVGATVKWTGKFLKE